VMPPPRPCAPDRRIVTRPSPRPTPPGRPSGQPPTSLKFVDSPLTTAPLAGCFAPHGETGSRRPRVAGRERVVLFMSTQDEATGFPPRGSVDPLPIIGPCRNRCQLDTGTLQARTNATFGLWHSGEIGDPVARAESLPRPPLGLRDLLYGQFVRYQAEPSPELIHHVCDDRRAGHGRLLAQRTHPPVG
jgi:hypothetical protein